MKSATRPFYVFCSVVLRFFFILFIGTACHVKIPEGEIPCDGLGDTKSCPNGFHCHSDKFCYSTEPGEPGEDSSNPVGTYRNFVTPSDIDSGSYSNLFDPSLNVDGDAGDLQDVPNCVPTTTSCDAECGEIKDECGNPISCGKCSKSETCIDNKCVPDCGGCLIDDECYDPGVINPDNVCKVCRLELSTTEWSANDGMLCDDGKYCTISDACDGDECTGEPRSCDDGIECNGNEVCSEEKRACEPGESLCGEDELCDAATDQCVTACEGCVIGITCFKDGVRNPANDCQVCNTAESTEAWVADVNHECGDSPTECSNQDTCNKKGECAARHKDEGVSCGEGPTDCSDQDTCDGSGNCIPNHYAARKICPPDPPPPCELPFRCDGAGHCVDTEEAECEQGIIGMECGSNETECSNQDTCDCYGTCQPNHKNSNVRCGNEPNSDCKNHDHCNGSGGCVSGGNKAGGTACGDTDDTDCTDPDTCDGKGNCQPNDEEDWTECGKQEDTCWTGYCVEGGCFTYIDAALCNDNNECTDDSCDILWGTCYNYPRTNQGCTGDGKECTDDYCNSSGECIHPDRTGSCTDDGEECTDDKCKDGECTHPARTGSCTDDGEECTDDKCKDGECTHPARDGIGCTDDGTICTIDKCNTSGVCVHTPQNADEKCESDGEKCTQDICNNNGICTHDQLNEGECGIQTGCREDYCAIENDGTIYCETGLDDDSCPDDNNPCTSAECLDDGGCQSENLSGIGCEIDAGTGTCVDGGCVVPDAGI